MFIKNYFKQLQMWIMSMKDKSTEKDLPIILSSKVNIHDFMEKNSFIWVSDT